jgi:acyl carrier protein
MNLDAIRSAVLECLRQVAPEMNPADLNPAENVRQALDIDSYDFLQFLVAVSEKLGVDVPEADYEKLTTFSSITDYLAARIKG